jgi:hypothetical protein
MRQHVTSARTWDRLGIPSRKSHFWKGLVMSRFEIHCPGCNVSLQVNSGSFGKKGHCRSCGAYFPIRPQGHTLSSVATARGDLSALNDTVVGWLGACDEGETPAAHANSLPATHVAAAPARLAPARFRPRHGRSNCSSTIYPVRLEHVDSTGATLCFSSRLLYHDGFRAIFPQQCIACSLREDLSVHVVIWGPPYQPKVMPLPIPLRHLGGLRGRALLKKLSPLRDLPEPYSLPMPYYVCGACPVTDTLQACVVREVYEDCRLKILSLGPAEAFLAAARGMDCEDLLRIRQMRPGQADPWMLLPTGVRIRLAHWYKPHKGERFQAFIADQEAALHEGGHAGIVLTDRRMVCHKGMRDIEVPLSDPLSLVTQLHDDSDHVRLEITSDTGQQAWFLIHQAGLRQLQQTIAGIYAK